MKLTSVLILIFSVLETVIGLPLLDRDNEPNTLLSVLARQEDLSIFSAVIRQSGGSQPNPAFEERFNSPLDGRNYTAFVPTNAAMLKIPTATLDLLARPQSYELLESLVRFHITEGMYTASDLTAAATSTSGQSQLISIEGFPLTITKNPTSNSDGEEATSLKVNEANLNLTDIPASNGRIHTIDRLLNPYSSYFGISTSSSAPTKSPPLAENITTIADILASDPRLSTLHTQIQTVDPDFLTRLSLSPSASASKTHPSLEQQVYFAPSNEAFTRIAVESMGAPSNAGLSRYLLTYGLLQGEGLAEKLNMQTEGPVESVSGFDINVRKKGDAWMVGNVAVVQSDLCVGNGGGCVWIVDGLLDPLFGVL